MRARRRERARRRARKEKGGDIYTLARVWAEHTVPVRPGRLSEEYVHQVRLVEINTAGAAHPPVGRELLLDRGVCTGGDPASLRRLRPLIAPAGPV